MIDVHPIDKREAAEITELMEFLDEQGNITPYAPGERAFTEEDILHLIHEVRESGDLCIVAYDGEAIVGYLQATRGQLDRMRHMAEVEMGILPNYTDIENGGPLLDFADIWAKQNDILRLECTLNAGNYPLVHLYQNMGYKIEGVRRSSLFVDERCVNEYYIAKLLNGEEDRRIALAALLNDSNEP